MRSRSRARTALLVWAITSGAATGCTGLSRESSSPPVATTSPTSTDTSAAIAPTPIETPVNASARDSFADGSTDDAASLSGVETVAEHPASRESTLADLAILTGPGNDVVSGQLHDHPTEHISDKPTTFPPRLGDNQTLHSDLQEQERREATQKALFDALQAKIASDQDLASLRSRDLTPIAVLEGAAASADGSRRRYQFFDAARSVTVVVAESESGTHSLEEIPAKDFQPELVASEEDEAIRLARAALAADHPTVTTMRGWAILTYPTTGDGNFPTRVVYVNFSVDDTRLPSFGATVDLSDGSVSDLRVLQ